MAHLESRQGAALLPGTDSPLAIEMFCRRSRPRGDGPAFDNLQVTRRIAKEQP